MSIAGMFRTKKSMYIGYTVACSLFFIWYLFPSEFFTEYLEKRINSLGSSVSVDIKSVKPALPLGAKLSGITATFSDGQVIHADTVKLSPGILSLIKFKPAIQCSMDIFGGSVSGSLRIPGGNMNNLSVEAMEISDVKLEMLTGLLSLVAPGYGISGELNAEGFYSSEGDTTGKLTLGLSDLVVTPENPLFTVEKLNFREVSAEFDLSKNKLQVAKCDIDGLEADGDISGTIFIRKPLTRSTLRLKGSVRPEQEFIDKLSETVPVQAFLGSNAGDGIQFKVSGSVSSPKLSRK